MWRSLGGGLVLIAAAAGAQDAVIAGRLGGIPRGAASAGATTVRSLEVETGVLTAALGLRKAKRFRLEASALPTLVVVEAFNLRSGVLRSGVTEVLRLSAGRRTRERLRLSSPATPFAAATVRPLEASCQPTDPCVTYLGISKQNFTVSGVGPELSAGLPAMLTTDVLAMKCVPSRVRVVEVDYVHVLRAEIAFTQSPAADPATRLNDCIISPTELLHGSIVASGAEMTLSAGTSRGTVSVTGPADRFFELEEDLARELEALLCADDGPLTGTASEDAHLTDPFGGTLDRHVEATVTWMPAPFDPTGTIFQPSGSVTYSATGTAGPCTILLPATTFTIGPNDGLLQFFPDGQYQAWGTGAGNGLAFTLDYRHTCAGTTMVIPGDVKPWLQMEPQAAVCGGSVLEGTSGNGGITYRWHFAR